MASTSTSKQAMLVDRPLLSFARIGSTACLTASTNLNRIVGTGCTLIVDCSANDGAVIDSMTVVENQSSVTASRICVFISTAISASLITDLNTAYVTGVTINGSGTLGTRTNIPLPPLSVPVPCLASPAATVSAYPDEVEKKNTGLYVPSGALLYVGTDVILTNPAGTQLTVFAQGGFF